MGIATVRLDGIEKAVRSTVDAVVASNVSVRWQVPDWTRQVKTSLTKLGQQRGFYVCAAGCKAAENGEWLFDLVWLKYHPRGFLMRVPLVVESEWQPSGVENDFQKLVLARADHRVMLLTSARQREIKKNAERLLSHAKSFARTGTVDRYLFGCWSEAHWRFDWLAYEVRAD